MDTEKELVMRSGGVCECCGNDQNCSPMAVKPKSGENADECIYCCELCRKDIENPAGADPQHWRCLNSCIWSEFAPVQVVAWRMLLNLKNEDWAADLSAMMYMDDDTRLWAESGTDQTEGAMGHKDCNGQTLATGDSVVLIKDLDVKGANFTAKRGTVVRNIRLVEDNPEQIEGKAEGQQIVILTRFVKKQ